MFTNITLENVRIFGERGFSFPLSGLTVFCGTNSCGKSTILKSLLLLRLSQHVTESLGTTPGKLRFVGSKIDLGNYSSFVSHGEIQHEMRISVTTEYNMKIEDYSALYSVKYDDDVSMPSKVTKLGSRDYVLSQLEANFVFGARPETDVSELPLFHSRDEDWNGRIQGTRGFLKSTNYRIIVDDAELLSWDIVYQRQTKKDKPHYHIYLPKDYIYSFKIPRDPRFEEAEDKNLLMTEAFLSGILPDRIRIGFIEAQNDDSAEADRELKWESYPLPPHMARAIESLRYHLQRLFYLGPLRAPAKRYYITNLDVEDPDLLDPSGELLPYILRYKDDLEVSNAHPDFSQVTREKLGTALNTWLYFIRTGEMLEEKLSINEIALSSLKDVILELEVRTVGGRESYPLADSGFGYSQILPILVRGLLCKPGDALLIEQPELHLNPALQVRLGSFLVAMMLAGKQVVIETHSEHVVNAIRVLVAEDKSDQIRSNCSLLFIDVKDGIPLIRSLSVKEDGTVPDWPVNFFGEASSLTGRLLRAQKRFRKQKATSS